MKKLIVYVHGRGGNANEAGHYEALFPEWDVAGLDYHTDSPWETGPEIRKLMEKYREEYDQIQLIANSIGAFYSMCAGIGEWITQAWFISPMVDMEKLITNMMKWAHVTEAELEARRRIPTDFGETLSWEYLGWVRKHPVEWTAPTHILYGSLDQLIDFQTMSAFAEKIHANLTVMDGGEHWFHTEEQMFFLDQWIGKKQ